MANTIINELRELNRQFLANDKNGKKVDDKSYIYKVSKIPILLSAPHAVRQFRESQVKVSDYLTGPLAIYLANSCDCSYFVRVFNDNDDPNFPLGETLSCVKNEYLKALKQFILEHDQFLIIDIHGCVTSEQYDCSLWHHDYRTCDRQIVKIFEGCLARHQLTVDDGSLYLGGQVTRQASLVTNAFQVELNRKIRTLKLKNYYLLKAFIDSMSEAIHETCDYSMKMKEARRIQDEYNK